MQMEMEALGAQQTRTETSACIKMLAAYKKLSDLPDNHNQLLKDKTLLLFVANVLDTKNQEALGLCLDILHNLVSTDAKNHQTILNVFGLFEALNYLTISCKKMSEKNFAKLTYILNELRTAMKQPRTKRTNREKYTLYNIYLPDLSESTEGRYRKCLLGIKGIVSFVMDLESNSCLVRISSPHTIQQIIEKIQHLTDVYAMLIIFNAKGNKEYVDPFDTALNFEYDDQKSFIQAPLHFFGRHFSQSKNGIKSLVDIWNKNFYW